MFNSTAVHIECGACRQ